MRSNKANLANLRALKLRLQASAPARVKLATPHVLAEYDGPAEALPEFAEVIRAGQGAQSSKALWANVAAAKRAATAATGNKDLQQIDAKKTELDRQSTCFVGVVWPRPRPKAGSMTKRASVG